MSQRHIHIITLFFFLVILRLVQIRQVNLSMITLFVFCNVQEVLCQTVPTSNGMATISPTLNLAPRARERTRPRRDGRRRITRASIPTPSPRQDPKTAARRPQRLLRPSRNRRSDHHAKNGMSSTRPHPANEQVRVRLVRALKSLSVERRRAAPARIGRRGSLVAAPRRPTSRLPEAASRPVAVGVRNLPAHGYSTAIQRDTSLKSTAWASA